jgi:predicted DNA-binding transcriptional regulator AlpA
LAGFCCLEFFVEDRISKETAAGLIGVSSRWLDEMHKRGEGPPRYKIGMHVSYSRSQVHAWIETQRQASVAVDQAQA